MKNLSVLLMTLALFASCDLATKGERITAYSAPEQALLVLDIQNDFVGNDARMPVEPEQAAGMIERVNAISADFLRDGRSVIYIRNVFPKNDIGNLFRNNAAVEGTEGIRIDPRIVQVSSIVFDKSRPDAFSNRAFERYLIDQRIDELTLCGVFADQCVYWTSAAALQRGYKVRYMINGVAAKNEKTIIHAANSIKGKGAIVFQY